MNLVRGSLLLLLALASPVPLSAADVALPEPLTLEAALEMADAQHPDLLEAEAQRKLAQAGLQSQEADMGVSVSLEGRARWVEPPDFVTDTSNDDHKVALVARKKLYDFGLSSAREASARSTLQGQQFAYSNTLNQRRIEIMERYFDVLLADKRFAMANENMAVVYVTLDRLRSRAELGQVSDIELLEMEDEYQQAFLERTESENMQRITRSRLAIALNRPTQLPSTLVPPDLSNYQREIPGYEPLIEAAMNQNPAIKAMQAKLEAAQQAIEAARNNYGPKLNAELEAASYTRELGSSDTMRAGIYFEVPLYTGGRSDATVAKAEAARQQVQSALRRTQDEVRQAVLEQWMALSRLKVKRGKVDALRDYRELYLDRSRTLYEMEVKADLGDAMVRLTESQLEQIRYQFELALAWERLDALTGGVVADAGSDLPKQN